MQSYVNTNINNLEYWLFDSFTVVAKKINKTKYLFSWCTHNQESKHNNHNTMAMYKKIIHLTKQLVVNDMYELFSEFSLFILNAYGKK